MSAIIPFQFEAHAVRVQIDELGLPWFNATDVCDALEMGNPSQAIKSHVAIVAVCAGTLGFLVEVLADVAHDLCDALRR